MTAMLDEAIAKVKNRRFHLPAGYDDKELEAAQAQHDWFLKLLADMKSEPLQKVEKI